MRSDTIGKLGRIAALCAALTVLFSLFLGAVRPWYLSWGASTQEVTSTLPGDELLKAGASLSTRAITIEAPVDRVWPWLLQLGQDRGGFYSYELLEDLVGTNMQNVDSLRPELQHWRVGDKLWMYPPDKLGGAGHGVLQRIDRGRALVFGTRQIGTPLNEPINGTWAFVLRPIDQSRTRLLVRGRALAADSSIQRGFDRLVFEPVHFVMERKMLEGIKSRAERRSTSSATDVLEVLLFATCFAFFVAAVVRMVRWPKAKRSILVVLTAGFAFQLLTFIQPTWIVGFVMVALLAVLFEFAAQA